MWLYSILLLCSLSVPLVLSFDKKLEFYKQWKYIIPSILIIAAFYILADIYLTKLGIWGFDSRYHLNILIANLPLEEWLFFLFIPYACVFLHESIVLYFPWLKLNLIWTRIIIVFLILMAAIVVLFYSDRIYTVYIFSLVIAALLLAFVDSTHQISSYFVSFLLILIPFIIVNAILTGSFIHHQVVWYNDQENMGIRILTIPVEDVGYAFSMVLFNLLLIPQLKKIF
jgi:lycopene cyclase domain-containing protein